MLYLDASVLVKRYAQEKGSQAVRARMRRGERVFTSAVSHAEILAAMGRKLRTGDMSLPQFELEKERFIAHWVQHINVLPVDFNTMGSVQTLVSRFPVRALDAIHLSTALWLRDTLRQVPEFAKGESQLEFGQRCDRL